MNDAVPVFLLLMPLSRGGAPESNWANEFDGHFQFVCPVGSYLTNVESFFNSYYNDRKFSFQCNARLDSPVEVSSCFWTDYVNAMDSPIVFQCGSGVIHGIESYHQDTYEDRRFKFKCCNLPLTCETNCHYTGWVNDLQGPFTYIAPDNYFIRGVVSFHDNKAEDRKFDFEVCALPTACDYHHHHSHNPTKPISTQSTSITNGTTAWAVLG
ncbi:hemagglutinin/amebocyte aggregation factor [Magallana gigas]|uniref:hemagglutinin/amebocyte aggregation factor n=1 Tax=Magallana gigas TaxID=29159 RepID=UPI0005C3B771|eukprot:XP_011438693.1 PREDICTED: hemagglutinin/amebocyte aggregation factor [Crassostrea gigas]